MRYYLRGNNVVRPRITLSYREDRDGAARGQMTCRRSYMCTVCLVINLSDPPTDVAG